MARIYLSGQFEDGEALCRVRVDLTAAGHVVTSRWLDSASLGPATARSAEPDGPQRLARIAQQDVEDIAAADVVVVFNPVESCAVGRGGRHVETGYALAYGKRVVVVGTRSNVFHWLPQVTVVADWAALTPYLEAEFATN